MGSNTYQVTTGNDDGAINIDGTFSKSITSFPIGKGYSSPDQLFDKIFARWYVTIPEDVEILSAYISLYWDNAAWTELPTCNIYFDKQQNSAEISSESDFDSRTKTTSYGSWTVTWNNGWNNSGSLVNPIQELVDAYNLNGTYIQALIVTPYSGGSRFKSYDGSSTYAPKLFVETSGNSIIPLVSGNYRRRRVA